MRAAQGLQRRRAAPGASLLRAAEDRGDLGVGEVAGEAQGQRRRAGAAAGARTRAQARRRRSASPGRRRRARRARAPPRRAPAARRAGAVMVERLAVGDRQHPAAQVLGVAQPRVGAHRGEERLLEAVVGVLAADRRHEEAPDRLALLVEEALEGGRGHRTYERARRRGREVRAYAVGVLVEAVPGLHAEPPGQHELAQQRRGAVGRSPRSACSASRTARTWSRPIASPQASGPRGWLSPRTMPGVDVVGRADALAERERRLVDELADDPARARARARRRPTRCAGRAWRRTRSARSALCGARAGRARQLDEPARGERRQRVEADRGAAAVERGERALGAAARATGPPCSGSSPGAPPQSTIRYGHVAVGVARRRARPSRPRSASTRSSSATCRSPAIDDHPAVGAPAGSGAGGSSGSRRSRRPRRRRTSRGRSCGRAARWRPSARSAATGASAARRSSARRRLATPSKPGVDADEVLQLERAHAEAAAEPRDAVDCVATSARPSCTQRSASRPNGRPQRLTRKPGPSAASMTRRPIASPVARASASARSPVSARRR